MCGTWLRLVEIADNAAFELCVPYGFVGARESDVGTDALTIIEC